MVNLRILFFDTVSLPMILLIQNYCFTHKSKVQKAEDVVQWKNAGLTCEVLELVSNTTHIHTEE